MSGYGIAHGSWEIATKSFYLFFLNSFFVALATYFVVRYLRFPYKSYSSKQERRKNRRFFVFFTIIMIIPSIWIFADVLVEARDARRLDHFIHDYIGEDYIFLDDYEFLTLEDDSRKLILKVYGDSISKAKIPYYQEGLEAVKIKNTVIEIIPTSEINLSKIRQLESELSGLGDQINDQIVKLEAEKSTQQEMLEAVQLRNDIMRLDSVKFREVSEEVKIFLPEIQSIRIAVSSFSNFENIEERLPLAIVKWNKPSEEKKQQLYSYLIKSYDLDTLVLLIE
ncbi:MAG: hypothetical protein HKN09_07845 [Saprospiraceae bacterium]|nr:hypothetical protein [Saprospiraceae bacterium]